MKYRKKPIEIEAAQLSYGNAEQIAEWCGGRVDTRIKTDFKTKTKAVAITTLEGVMWADEGDYVIKGIKGEFYPCKPDIFEASYDAVDE